MPPTGKHGCRVEDVLSRPPQRGLMGTSQPDWPNRGGLKWCAADRLAQGGVGVGDSGAQRTRLTSISPTGASVACRACRARPRLR